MPRLLKSAIKGHAGLLVSIMALTLAAVAETSAKSGSIKDFSDKDLCDGS
jgi:hypothetical protein